LTSVDLTSVDLTSTAYDSAYLTNEENDNTFKEVTKRSSKSKKNLNYGLPKFYNKFDIHDNKKLKDIEKKFNNNIKRNVQEEIQEIQKEIIDSFRKKSKKNWADISSDDE
jgi:hypothetical protein